MFEFIRSHQRLMQLLLLLLILPSFAFFGLNSYSRFSDGDAGVASVGGLPITQQDFDAAQRKQMDRMQQMLGANADPKIFDTPEARRQLLDELIGQRVLLDQISRRRLSVSKDRVSEELAKNPAIKALYKPDGTLDVDRYDQLLASAGMTRDQVFDGTRRDLLLQEVTTTVPSSSMVPHAIAVRLEAAVSQVREVQELREKPADFVAEVKLPADAVQKYYDAHASDFSIPEQADIEYLVLDSASLSSKEVVKPEDVKKFYDDNQTKYEVAEERRASHILIAVAKDASADVRNKAKARAEEVLGKVKANPADFGKLATEYSDDKGSAANGGDLDFAGRGAYVPPFETALFGLKEGEISGIVQTDFGYHIIKMTGDHPATAKPFDQVKGDIELSLRKEAAAKHFTEAAETFSNSVYEQPDSLKPAADKLGLTILTASGITQSAPANANALDVLANAKLRAALFSDDSLKKKHNTVAIEINPTTLVAARVVSLHAAAHRPLSEVEQSVRKLVTDAEAERLSQAAGQKKLAEIVKAGGADDAGFSPAQEVGRRIQSKLPREAVVQILKADVSKLPTFVGVDLGADGYAIYRIAKVSNPPSNPAAIQSISDQLAKQTGDLEFSGYMDLLKKGSKVKISKSFDAPAAPVTPKS